MISSSRPLMKEEPEMNFDSILVVDNNPVMLKFMSGMLQKKGYTVFSAEDGLSASGILKKHIPDVIFVDLIMPNISGKQLCRMIRKDPRLKDVRIVILSAVAAEEEPNLAELKADACIAKGSFKAMAENVTTVLSRLKSGESEGLEKGIIGADSVAPRAISRELLSTQRHFEIILANMTEGILELSPDSRIVYANPVAASLLGKPEVVLLASEFTSLFHEEDRRRIERVLKELGDIPRVLPEEPPVKLNGRRFAMKMIPIRGNGDRAVIVMLNDVTDRKKIEAQLLHARKMEAIGTLAGGIAHDYNNLLMGIEGYASLILSKAPPDTEYREYVEAIEESVQRGSDLTRQLLTFARGGQYNARPTDINDVIRKSVSMFGRTRKEISIHEKYDEKIWLVEVDRGQMEQVLLNLFVNAWQAMPGGGDLYIRTENAVLDETTLARFKIIPGDYVRISVTDTGIGMDDRTRQRIFEPFFTTKEMGRGTGLGLASVYGIIENHGGFINVYSEQGKGTTFNVYLPAIKKGRVLEKPRRERTLTGTETILLVDDEAMIVDVAREMLKSLGYTVLTASGGEEAVAIYEKKHDRIDMIILDMIMPGMGGAETFERLRKINPEAKVLLSSGYSIDGQAEDILSRGCNGFIQKPFNLPKLSRRVREILDNTAQGGPGKN